MKKKRRRRRPFNNVNRRKFQFFIYLARWMKKKKTGTARRCCISLRFCSKFLQCDFHVAFRLRSSGSERGNGEITHRLGTNWNKKGIEWKMRLALAQTSLKFSTHLHAVFCMTWQHELAASCQKNCYISCLFFPLRHGSIVSLFALFLLLLSEIYSTELSPSSSCTRRSLWQHFIFTMATLPPSKHCQLEEREGEMWD